jgi:hypothetical protein
MGDGMERRIKLKIGSLTVPGAGPVDAARITAAVEKAVSRSLTGQGAAVAHDVAKSTSRQVTNAVGARLGVPGAKR